MTEFTPELAGRVAMRVLFEEWRRQIAAGRLSDAWLLAIRGRLTSCDESACKPTNDRPHDPAHCTDGGWRILHLRLAYHPPNTRATRRRRRRARTRQPRR